MLIYTTLFRSLCKGEEGGTEFPHTKSFYGFYWVLKGVYIHEGVWVRSFVSNLDEGQRVDPVQLKGLNRDQCLLGEGAFLGHLIPL
jgi:hypothetical protein